jgi:carboxymethylenebutenolidase
VDATVPDTTKAMKAAGKFYDPVTYEGAGHGFMRAGEDPSNTNPANKTARDQAFARLVKLLKDMKTAKTASRGESHQTTAKAQSAPECHDTASSM